MEIGDAVSRMIEDQVDEITQAMGLCEDDPSVSLTLNIKLDPVEWACKLSFVKEKRTVKISGMRGVEPLPFPRATPSD
jgi:hypothetical protein